MKYAIDMRKDKYMVIDTEKNKLVTPFYDKERLALKWIKTATGFKFDISQLQVERLYEKRLEEKLEETFTTSDITETVIMGDMDNSPPEVLVLEEPKEELTPWEPMYHCTDCNRNHEKTSKIGRNHLKYREVN